MLRTSLRVNGGRAVALVAFLGAIASAEEARGFVELRGSLFPGAAFDKLQLVERARPTFTTELAERVKLVATVEADLAQGRDTGVVVDRLLRTQGFGPLLDAAGCGPAPHANSFLRIDGASDVLEVDRLYVDVYREAFDVRVGRQAINWGSARFFNPTDPFPEVLLAEPWRPRRGVNAVRVEVPLGSTADLMAVIGADDAFTSVRAAGRARVRWKGTDYAVVGGRRGDLSSSFVGLDVRGTAVVGFWLEGAWVLSKTPHEELSAGVDYSFPVLEQLQVWAQYYRNGAGLASPDQYAGALSRLSAASPLVCSGSAALFGSSPTAKPDPFAPFTVGRDYLMLGATLGVSPELSVSLTGLQNLNDGTALVIPVVSWAVTDWLDVAASGSVPAVVFGQGGELHPRPKDLTVTVPTPSGPRTANFAGLVPATTLTAWTRFSF
jgi:hypothetical protein